MLNQKLLRVSRFAFLLFRSQEQLIELLAK